MERRQQPGGPPAPARFRDFDGKLAAEEVPSSVVPMPATDECAEKGGRSSLACYFADQEAVGEGRFAHHGVRAADEVLHAGEEACLERLEAAGFLSRVLLGTGEEYTHIRKAGASVTKGTSSIFCV